MKYQVHQTAPRGLSRSSARSRIADREEPRIRYAVVRLILDQGGERYIGFRTQSAFVWAEPEVAKRFAVCANDPKFRFIRG